MNGCLNKGSCIFDQEKETFACSCKQPWGGERCELRKPILCNLFTARSLFVFHYHLKIYTGMAITLKIWNVCQTFFIKRNKNIFSQFAQYMSVARGLP